MVYPGAASGVHFEKMREGIVDFEKLKILKVLSEKSSDPTIKRTMNQLEQHLQTLNDERGFKKEKLKSDIQKGRKTVEELSDQLAGSKNK
jgi:hypothetical protein